LRPARLERGRAVSDRACKDAPEFQGVGRRPRGLSDGGDPAPA